MDNPKITHIEVYFDANKAEVNIDQGYCPDEQFEHVLVTRDPLVRYITITLETKEVLRASKTIKDNEMEIELISPNAMTSSVLVHEDDILYSPPSEIVAFYYPKLSGESHGTLH